MKFLVSLFLLFAAIHARGEGESVSILAADGKPDPKKVQTFIEWVQPAIHDYPARFADEKEKKIMTAATAQIVEEIKSMNPEKFQDAKLVTSLAFILSMGHNVDLRTFPYARAFFERALVLDPNDARANFLYGMFLVSTDRYHFDALPYLQKALAQGERQAQFPIGMLYFQKGDKQKALEQLKAYSAARPQDLYVGQVIKAIMDGSLRFDKPLNKEEGKAPPTPDNK